MKTWCGGCSLFCEDVSVEKDGDSVHLHQFCQRGEKWFDENCRHEDFESPCRIDGEYVPKEEATKLAIEWLKQSELPLVTGLVRCSCESQMALIEFAQRIGAAIDWTRSDGERRLLRTMQRVGKVSCSLGEIRERCDLLVVCCDDIEHSHPRFFERFVDRTRTRVCTLGIQSLAQVADEHIDCNTKDVALILRELQLQVSSEEVSSDSRTEVTCLLRNIEASQCCTFVINSRFADYFGIEALDALFRIIRRMNDRIQCNLIALSDSNARGAESTLTAITGFPFAVGFRHHSNPPKKDRHLFSVFGTGSKQDRRLRTVHRPSDLTAWQLLSDPTADLVINANDSEMSIPPSIRQITFSTATDFREQRTGIHFLYVEPGLPVTVVRTDGMPITMVTPTYQFDSSTTLQQLIYRLS